MVLVKDIYRLIINLNKGEENMKKKYKMIIAILCLCISVTIILIKIYQNNNNAFNVPQIQFPASANASNYTFVTENHLKTDQVKEISEDDSLRKVYILNESIDDSVINNIQKKFNINVDNKNITSEGITYGDINQLTVQNNGCLNFYSNADNALCEMTLSDEECKRRAGAIINDLGIFMEGYTFNGIIYGTCHDFDHPEDKIVISKEVVFTRGMDNSKVFGNSKVSVQLTGEGTVHSITANYRDIDKTIDIDKVVSVDQAISKLNNYEGFISVPEGTTKVELEDIQISYWEDSSEQYDNNTIQPVYELTGKAYNGNQLLGTFTALESVVDK